jgi:nucleotide-binding universal stress UspA family protein
MKILLPVYSMADAKMIVDFVSNYRWPPTSDFKVMHVIGGMATEEAYLKAEEEAGKLLASVVERLQKALPQAHFESEVLSGDPAYEVVSVAGKWQASMIVMGYRVRTDIQGQLAGSVSKSVTMNAPCSVAIIRPPVEAPTVLSVVKEEEQSQLSAPLGGACFGLH